MPQGGLCKGELGFKLASRLYGQKKPVRYQGCYFRWHRLPAIACLLNVSSKSPLSKGDKMFLISPDMG